MNMKIIFFTIFVFITINTAFSQDVVNTHDGNTYKVKIIKETPDYLFLYMQGDTTKTIRKIPLSTIYTYQYNSKNDLMSIKSDSILYSKYTGSNEKSNVLVKQQTNSEIQPFAYSSPAEKYFYNAQNFFIASAVASIASSIVIPIIAKNIEIPTDFNNPTYIEDLQDYSSRINNLQNTQYVLGGLSGIFIIGAGVNFSRGFIELSKINSIK